ncbi:hypothetical protein [Actinoplanes sp. NPDC020271]|uniref:hypothetical protein n=1 Tax=Actinoplanes sp. NPDC020271 TaxID=3363896 RepID=UPI0037B8624E
MLYRSPADFCAAYTEAHRGDRSGEAGEMTTLDAVTVVSQTPDTAQVEARWFTYGHYPDAGYYDVFHRTAFSLIKQDDGWCLQSEEDLGYE